MHVASFEKALSHLDVVVVTGAAAGVVAGAGAEVAAAGVAGVAVASDDGAGLAVAVAGTLSELVDVFLSA